jgi:hypothetical protein
MKKSLQVLLLVLIASFCWSASASAVVETRYTDSLYAFGEIPNLAAIKGAPDGLYAQIPSKSALYVLQAYYSYGGGNKRIHTLQDGATVDFYGQPIGTDPNSYLIVTFFKTLPDGTILYQSPDGTILYQSTPQKVSGTKTTLTLDSDYTLIEIASVLDENNGSIGYQLDAIAVTQNWLDVSVRSRQELSGGVIASYPNPFITTEAPAFELDVPDAGNVELLVLDITGREASRISLGYLNAGKYTERLPISTSGTYIAQLVVDGRRVGRTLKITGR